MSRWSEQKEKRNKSGGRKKRHIGGVALQVLRESEGGEIKSFNILLQQRERSKERDLGGGGFERNAALK